MRVPYATEILTVHFSCPFPQYLENSIRRHTSEQQKRFFSPQIKILCAKDLQLHLACHCLFTNVTYFLQLLSTSAVSKVINFDWNFAVDKKGVITNQNLHSKKSLACYVSFPWINTLLVHKYTPFCGFFYNSIFCTESRALRGSQLRIVYRQI